MDYLKLSLSLAQKVKSALTQELKSKGFFGVENDNPEDVKSTHKADKIAIAILEEELKGLPCQVFMESYQSELHPSPEFTLFIDPLDGSLNWDRGVGDAAFALAITEKPIEKATFNDLNFSFVQGLRSGDYYFADKGNSFFYSALLESTSQMRCRKQDALEHSHAYLKSGYQAAQRHFDQAMPLYLAVKDIRAFDQSALEICELARNAADIMLENRQLSDFYNLLAYPILRCAGGYMQTLDGRELGEQLLLPDQQYDFLAGNSKEIVEKAFSLLK